MTNEDKTTTGSSQQEPAEQIQNPPPEDDAILRNLDGLMGNDTQNRDNFNAPPPLVEDDNELHVADKKTLWR